jgi:LacI family transcriptional regulator
MNGRKPKDSPRATQKDVARRAGVSTSIVSYVINNGPRSVSEGTRQRVLQAIEELGYRPYAQRQLVMREKWGSREIIQASF